MEVLIKNIENSNTIAILPHISFDGDTLGSSMALYISLKKIGKSVDIIGEEKVSNYLSLIPNVDKLQMYEGKPKKYDLIIAVDCGDRERLGKRIELFDLAIKTINFDHHPTNTEFAMYNYVNTSSAATGEIIFELIKKMNLEIDKEIAVCLYIAITSDTGGFRYSNTTAKTHLIAAELINKGVKVSEITQELFENVSLNRLKLTSLAVDQMEIIENGRISIITISQEFFNKTGAEEEDAAGLVNVGRSLQGVEVAVFLREREDGKIKVSLRSKNHVDVALISSFFKGGGHKRAAGFEFNKNNPEIKEELIQEIIKQLYNPIL